MSSPYTPSTHSLYKNENATNWCCRDDDYLSTKDMIKHFQLNMQHYHPSNLIEIPNPYGVRLFVKEESERYNLPSFKILGASWGVFRCLIKKFEMPLASTSLNQLRQHIKKEYPRLVLVAATDGNHGRAVAYMAKLLHTESKIFVPWHVLDSECDKIRQENDTEVIRIPGSYDEAVDASFQYVRKDASNHILIQDFAFEGYGEVPSWIAHGYSTLCTEIPFCPDIIFIPCGAGCFAQGVTTYYRSFNSGTRICLVEPDTAYAVNKSLFLDEPSSDPGISKTIMDGLNCPTVSQTAFPILQKGVTYSSLVSDKDCCNAINALKTLGINSGPCGAVTYAAFMNHVESLLLEGDLKKGNRVVLVSTEAYREYRLN